MTTHLNLLGRINKLRFICLPFLLIIIVFLFSSISCKKEYDNENNTSNAFTDPRDGNVYSTIKIGGQLWMAENLRYLPNVSHPIVGINILPFYYVNGYYGTQTGDAGFVTNLSEAKEAENYNKYGVLYNWPAALSSCPLGWHLPSDEEWKVLIDFFGGDSLAGHKLRNRDQILWDDPWYGPDSTSTNESGFSAIPGGRRNPAGTFGGMGMYSYFWSSTDKPDDSAWDGNAWYVVLVNNDIAAYRHNYFGKEVGFSVRCLKD